MSSAASAAVGAWPTSPGSPPRPSASPAASSCHPRRLDGPPPRQRHRCPDRRRVPACSRDGWRILHPGDLRFCLQPIVKDMPRRTRHLPPRHHQISLPIPLPSQRHVDQPLKPLCGQGMGISRLRQRAVSQVVFCGEASSTAVIVPSCALQSRTWRRLRRWPSAILDLRCARWPVGGQVGTTGCRLSIEQRDDVRPLPGRGVARTACGRARRRRRHQAVCAEGRGPCLRRR